MSEPTLVPITDEQAKLGQEALKVAKDLGGYFGDQLDDLPKNLLGLLGGDFIKIRRQERIANMVQDALERLRERGIIEPPALAPKLALQFLSAAADENRDELLDLWARLLASAMDPNRRNNFRQLFIDTIKQIDPFDALVFNKIVEN